MLNIGGIQTRSFYRRIGTLSDWSVKCTGYGKHGKPNKDVTNLLKKRSRRLGRQLKCDGPECHRMIQYKEKLFSEEAKKG